MTSIILKSYPEENDFESGGYGGNWIVNSQNPATTDPVNVDIGEYIINVNDSHPMYISHGESATAGDPSNAAANEFVEIIGGTASNNGVYGSQLILAVKKKFSPNLLAIRCATHAAMNIKLEFKEAEEHALSLSNAIHNQKLIDNSIAEVEALQLTCKSLLKQFADQKDYSENAIKDAMNNITSLGITNIDLNNTKFIDPRVGRLWHTGKVRKVTQPGTGVTHGKISFYDTQTGKYPDDGVTLLDVLQTFGGKRRNVFDKTTKVNYDVDSSNNDIRRKVNEHLMPTIDHTLKSLVAINSILNGSSDPSDISDDGANISIIPEGATLSPDDLAAGLTAGDLSSSYRPGEKHKLHEGMILQLTGAYTKINDETTGEMRLKYETAAQRKTHSGNIIAAAKETASKLNGTELARARSNIGLGASTSRKKSR